MGIEIERKYLVRGDSWRDGVEESIRIDQGYIASMGATVRVRTWNEGAYVTIKGPTTNMTRSEWEWAIDYDEAVEMLDELCAGRRLTKTRYVLRHGDHEWVVDDFEGDFDGLVLAEIELESEDEDFELPDWVGEEVTGDRRYYNANLADRGLD